MLLAWVSTLTLSLLPNRTSLAYDEQEKTGSGALRQALPHAVVGCSDRWRQDGRQHAPAASKMNKRFCPRDASFGCGESEACYVETGPSRGASSKLAQSHYVISSVREPCDWLVSLFFWRRPDLAAQNITESKAPFESWVRAEKESAVLSGYEAAHTVNKTLEFHVDCWVYVGSDGVFERSLRGCLHAFESQGGRVNWESHHLSPYLKEAKAADPACTVDKNAPGAGHCHAHSKCASFYDAALASFVEERARPLYRTFGWKGCCLGR